MSIPFNRHYPRLATYDYSSPGAYFVTLCTVERQALFHRAELRTILEETWKALPQRFPAVKLDEFVIMPNHIHFILWLKEDVEDRPVLGKVIGAYKSLRAVAWTHHTGTPGSGQFWQKNYYEHIIRGELDLREKREYIRNNPVKDQLKREGIALSSSMDRVIRPDPRRDPACRVRVLACAAREETPQAPFSP